MASSTRTFAGPLIGVLLVCAAVYGAGSGRMGFFGKDELRYAQIAKEMKSVGGFFVLHYQGELYPDKPPLYFWMARAAYSLTGGVAPLGARLPLILSTLFTVLVTFDIGRRLFGARAALLGALFYGLCFRAIWSAHTAKLDPPLVAFTTLALWFWVLGCDAYEAGRRPPFRCVAGFWIAMGLGFLVKGPLALIVPIGTLLAYCAARRKGRGVVGWTTLAGFALFLAVVGVWLVPAAHYGAPENYLGRIWDQEIVGRTAHPWRHVKEGIVDWLYYFLRIWPEFLPGSVFLPWACILAWRKRRENTREMHGVLFVALWFLFVIVFFTLAKSKRGQYILPLYPAAGLMVGWMLDRFLRAETPIWRWTAPPFAVLAALGLAAALAMQFSAPTFRERFQVSPSLLSRALVLVVMGGISVFVLLSALRGALGAAVGWSLALVPSGMVLAFLVYFPLGYDDAPFKAVAREVQARAGSEAIVWTHGSPDPYFNIYGDYYLRDIVEREARHASDSRGPRLSTKELRRACASRAFSPTAAPMLMILDGTRLGEYEQTLPDRSFQVLERFEIPRYDERGGVFLIANRSFRFERGDEEAGDSGLAASQ